MAAELFPAKKASPSSPSSGSIQRFQQQSRTWQGLFPTIRER